MTALGVAYRDHGDGPRAVRAFERAVELGDPYAMEYLAAVLEQRGERDRAAGLRASAVQARAGGLRTARVDTPGSGGNPPVKNSRMSDRGWPRHRRWEHRPPSVNVTLARFTLESAAEEIEHVLE